MNAEHAAEFDILLQASMEAHGRHRLSDFALRAWWAALAAYDWPEVEAALLQHLAHCKFAPTPADILERLTAQDGRPGEEEAWSIALQSMAEDLTVVWTSEIAAARAVAKPILDTGDEVGARKAFIEVYRRDVASARGAQRPATWEVSLGHDPQQREQALRDAERRGRLPSHAIAHLLPGSAQRAAESRTGPLSAAGMLTAENVRAFPATEERDRRRFVAAVREGLKHGAEAKATARAKRERAERQEHQALRQRRAETRAELQRRLDASEDPSSTPPKTA